MPVNGIIAIIISTILGYLSGQGIGGGSILMVWLTMILNLSFPIAKTINLLFYLIAVTVSLLLNQKQSSLPYHRILPMIGAAMIGAAILSCLSDYIRTGWIIKGFGILLIIAGIKELHFRER